MYFVSWKISELNTNTKIPERFYYNFPTTVNSSSFLKPRYFILYPKINEEITVFYSAVIRCEILTANLKNSTVSALPNITYSIGKLNDLNRDSGGSAWLSPDKSTSVVTIFNNSTFKITFLSKDCISYQTSLIYFTDVIYGTIGYHTDRTILC